MGKVMGFEENGESKMGAEGGTGGQNETGDEDHAGGRTGAAWRATGSTANTRRRTIHGEGLEEGEEREWSDFGGVRVWGRKGEGSRAMWSADRRRWEWV